MKSSFKIDFANLTGEGFEPIIKVVIGDEDMEDKLLKTLFMIMQINFLRILI